MFPIGIVKTL